MIGSELLKVAVTQLVVTAIILGSITAVELAWPRGEPSPLKARWRPASYYLISATFGAVTIWGLTRLWQMLGLRPLAHITLDAWLVWSGPLVALIAGVIVLLVNDFFGYWYHRVQHALLWPIHAVHHSVEDLTAASSYTHVTDSAFRFIFMVAPMSLVPLVTRQDLLAANLLLTVSQYYIHSPTRLHFGPLRRVVTDNIYHRIHHSADPAHFNRNYGTGFTIWDQLFGTSYFPTPGEWPSTGLENCPEPRTLSRFLLLPLSVRRNV